MIGDDYLQLRAQLGAAIFSLSSLAHDLHAEPAIFDGLHELGDRLREPLLLVAVGDASADKSSLLDALFGRECFAGGEEPSRSARLFTFGPEASDHQESGFIECRRPHRFLHDIHALDFSATAAVPSEDWEKIAPFLTQADVVLIVLSVTNPWASATWEAATFLAQHWAGKMAFVLQHADQRSAVEIAAVIQHVEQKVREKLSLSRPVFAVSAKNALLAKTTGADKERLLAGSGILGLEAFINEAFTHGDTSLQRLRETSQRAEKILAATGRKAREAMLALRMENDRLSALEHKLADRKEQSLRGVGGALWTLAQTCETAQKRGEELLQKRLSIFSTIKLLFQGAQWQDGIREEVEVRLREAMGKQIGNSVDLLQSDLKNVWRELHEWLGKSVGHESLPEPDFTVQRENLIRCIDVGLAPHFSAEQLDIELPHLLRQMAAWLRVPFGIAFSSGVAVVPATLAGLSITPMLGTGAVASAVLGLAMTTVKRNRLLAVYRETMISKREAMLAPIEDHLRHSIEVFFKSLPATFGLLRDFCLTQQQIYEPLLARAQQLDRMFGNMARELGAKSKE